MESIFSYRPLSPHSIQGFFKKKEAEFTSFFKRYVEKPFTSYCGLKQPETCDEFIRLLKESRYAFVETNEDSYFFHYLKRGEEEIFFKVTSFSVSTITKKSLKKTFFPTFKSVDFTKIQKRWKEGKLEALKRDVLKKESQDQEEDPLSELKKELQLMSDYLLKPTPQEDRDSLSSVKKIVIGFLALSATPLLARSAFVSYPSLASQKLFFDPLNSFSLFPQAEGALLDEGLTQRVEINSFLDEKVDVASLFEEVNLNQTYSLSLKRRNGLEAPSWITLEMNLESVGSLPLEEGYRVVISKGIVYCADSAQGVVICDFRNKREPVQIASISLPSVRDLCFGKNNTLFVADSVRGILAFNITYPESPTLISEFSTSVHNIVWHEGLLATSTESPSFGIQFFNVENPKNIIKVSEMPSLIETRGIGFYNGTVFYGMSLIQQGLVVIDVSNRAAPVLRRTIVTNGRPRFFAIRNDLLFLGTGDTSTLVQVFSLRNPLFPSLLATRQATQPNGWFVSEEYAFVADAESGLRVIDYSLPQNFSFVGSLPLSSRAFGVSVENNTAYVISTSKIEAIEINPLDVSLKGAPGISDQGEVALSLKLKRKTTEIASYPFTLTVDETPLITSFFPTLTTTPNSTQTFQWSLIPKDYFSSFNPLLIRFESPNFLDYRVQPLEIGRLSGIGQIFRIQMSGHTVYGVDYWSNLVVCDFSDLKAPREIRRIPLYIWDLVFDRNHLFACLGDFGMNIYSTVNPTNPTLVASLATFPFYVTTSFVKNNILYLSVVQAGYVLSNTTGLRLYDVTNPAAPLYLGAYSNIGTAGLYVDDEKRVYASGNNRLNILDVSNPSNIRSLSTIPIKGINYLVRDATLLLREGDFILFAEQTGLRVMNISDIAHPYDVNYIPLSIVNNLLLRNKILYVAVGGLGIQLYDATFLPELKLIGTYATEGSASDLLVEGNTLFAGTGTGGVSAININTSDLVWRLFGKGERAGNFNFDVIAQTPYGTEVRAPLTLRFEGPPEVDPSKTLANDIALTHLLYQKYVPLETFRDPNGDSIELSAFLEGDLPLPLFLTFNANSATFSGTPQVTDAGRYTIRVKGRTPTGSAETSFELFVNNAPMVQNLLPDLSMKVGGVLNYTISHDTFKDLDGDSLTYTIENKPDSLSFSQEGNLRGVLTTFDLGVRTMTITALDEKGGRASTPLKLLVQNEAAPQVNGYISSQQAVVGESFFFQLPPIFYDPDGDELTISVINTPKWLTWDGETRSFKGIPGQGDIGTFSAKTYKIQVIGTDGTLSATTSFDVTVTGTSVTENVLKAAGTIFALAVATFSWYRKRGLLLNPLMQQKRTYIRKKIEVGNKTLVIPIETEKEKTKAIKSYIGTAFNPDEEKPKWWKAFEPDTPIAGGQALPHWLIHDAGENKLRINPATEGPQVEEVIKVVISDYGDFRKEEITIQVGRFGKSFSRRHDSQNIELNNF